MFVVVENTGWIAAVDDVSVNVKVKMLVCIGEVKSAVIEYEDESTVFMPFVKIRFAPIGWLYEVEYMQATFAESLLIVTCKAGPSFEIASIAGVFTTRRFFALQSVN